MFIFGQRAEFVERLDHIRVTNSLQGLSVPLVFGTQRVPGLLVWFADFAAHKHHAGGSAFGAKSTTIYTYTASYIALLSEGPVKGINSIWDSGGKFVPLNATTNFSIPAGIGGNPPTIAASNFPNFAADQGITKAGVHMTRVDWDYLGGAAVPALSSGQYTNDNLGNYFFSAADVGASISIFNTYFYNLRITQEEHFVPSSGPFQFTANHGGIGADNKGIYRTDFGVRYFPSGTALTKVGSSPAVGQYTISVSNGIGTYGFNAGDASQNVLIQYEYDDYQDDKYAPSRLSVTFFPGVLGQAPWSFLNSSHPDQTLGYSSSCYAAFQNGYLGMSGVPPINSYEVIGFDVIGGGILDASPIDALKRILTDTNVGVGFPSQFIDQASWFTNNNSAQNWVKSQLLFISQAILNQESVASIAGRWLEAFQIASVWSEGLLKLIPYGDQSVTGSLASYTPNTGIVAELTDNDFILGDKADDPITVSRSPWTDAYNRVQINYQNRLYDYNQDVVYEQDEGSVERFSPVGQLTPRIEAPTSYDFITTWNVAAAAANMRLKRYVYVRNKYVFKTSWRLEYVEPMDLIQITDTRMGINNLVVRVIKTVNDPDGTIEFTCEDFPGDGYAMPFVNPKAHTPALHPVAGTAASEGTSAVIVEATNHTPNRQSTRLYIFCVGDNPNWAGCVVWISLDGTNYVPIGDPVTVPARIGTLTAALSSITPSPTAPFGVTFDNVHSLTINFGSTSVNPSTAGIPAWNATQIYQKGQQVSFDSQLWTALQQNQDSMPTVSSADWQLITSSQPPEAPISSVTALAASNLGTLSAVIGLATAPNLAASIIEFLSYTNVTPGSTPNSYVLSNLYRGAYGTSINTFPISSQFVRFDDASVVYDLPPGYQGSNVYVRFTAFNLVAGATQDLGNVDTFVLQIQPMGNAAVDFGPAVSSAFNTQGSYNCLSDNAAFSFGTTTTSISFWWTQFSIPLIDGTNVTVAAKGSSGSPAISFTGLTANTTYFISARFNIKTQTVEMMIGTSVLSTQQMSQWFNADGFDCVFINWQIATPSAGSSGGGGSGGGNRCFTGDILVRTLDGLKRFDEMRETETIINETGTWPADLIVHEDAETEVVPFMSGAVTANHLFRFGEGWLPAGSLFCRNKRKFRGKLYNLHVRSVDEKDKHYVLKGGYVAHNFKII